jgi:large repetitive protein
MRQRGKACLRGRARRADSVLTTPGFIGQVCYLAPPVGLKRLSLLAALAAALSLGVVSDASAGSIADFDPCPKSGGDLVCPVGTTGTPYSIKFHGDEDPICAPGDDKWRVGSGAVPPGLTLAENGLLSGTPTQEGTYAFWLELKLPDYYNPGPPPSGCSSRDNSEEHVSITIVPGLPRLIIGPESTTPGTMGKPYSLQMTATLEGEKTWSINSGALPPGVGIDAATGLISGTPTVAGQFDFQVLARMNGDTRVDTKALAIVVRDAVGILGTEPFTAARRAQGEVGVPFEALLAATGGTGTYTWSLTTGELPPGLTLTDGTIDGKPTAAGTYRFTATVTDTEGRVANYPARIIVAEKLSISTLLLRPAKVGFYYQAKLATSGGVLPRSWRVLRGPLPRGIRFDRSVGVLYGIPTRPGRWRVTFEATDALGVKAKKTLQIVVTAPPVPTKSG